MLLRGRSQLLQDCGSCKIDYLRTVTAKKRTAFDWDDVKIFLTVAQFGSLSAAARDLGVNHATVSRRLANLEAATRGVPLFERSAKGFVLSPAGRAAAADARSMHVHAEGFRRGIE